MKVFKSLSYWTCPGAIKEITKNSTPKITFWGTRYIETKDINTINCYTLDSIIKELSWGASTISFYDKSFIPQRITGIEVVEKMNEFYRITDEQIKNSHFFTKLSIWIRSFFSFSQKIRINFENNTKNDFLSYTYSMGNKIVIPEEELRTLASQKNQ